MRYTFFVPKNSHIQQITTEKQIEHTQKQIKNTSTKKDRNLAVFLVIRAGFKPATPTSVVWYSIQLS